ncbi:MAG: FAD-dependent oxidoreductase, partial [Bryocella sp.]
FYESFLKNSTGGRLGIPTQPMTEFYTALTTLATRQGTTTHFRSSVESISRLPDGDWQAHTSDDALHTASQLILALPFEQTARLIATLSTEDQAALGLNFKAFTHAPITTLHLWFDRHITDLDHAALLDTRIQWMFNKTRIRRDEPGVAQGSGQYLELVISASFPELEQQRETILEAGLEELASFFPVVREARLIKTGLLKEARATFSVTPGLDAFRPSAQSALPGLVLAGDWTRTGWPSTMEGAVRSGRLAAEAVTSAVGTRQPFLAPDLPPSALMNLLVR